MRSNLKPLLSLVMVVAFLFCTGCSTSPAGVPEQGVTNSNGDVVAVDANAGVSADMESIVRFGRDWPTYYDPAVGSSYTCSIAQTSIYDALVYFDNETSTVVPHVAESWDISEDGMTYTFYLRDDVKFHSGNILKASDAEYSMKRLLKIGQGPAYLYTSYVADCYAEGDNIFVVKLSHPFAPFINALPRFFIVEQALVEANYDMSVTTYNEFGDYGTNWLLTHDAGSGPYKTYEFMLEEYIIGERFEDYFLGWEGDFAKAPQYFKMSNMADPVAQRTAFANQELEVSSDVLPQETYNELAAMGASIVNKTGIGCWSILMNTKIAPTDDVNFRKALAYAFDYDTMHNVIFPSSERMTGPVADGFFGKNEELEGYSFDLEKAKEYIAKSKYANDPSAWVITMSWCAEIPEQEKLSLMFQAALEQIGVKLEITKKPFSAMSADAQTIETTPNTSIVQWSPDYFEAGSVFKTRYHSDSAGTWEQMEWLLDDKLDAMIDDALCTIDDAQREAKYKEIEAYIVDLCPTIWMGSNGCLIAVQPYVDWDLLDTSNEGKACPSIVGYDINFRNMRINLEKK